MSIPNVGDIVVFRKRHLKKGDIPEVQGMVVSVNKVWGYDDKYRVVIQTDQKSPCFNAFISWDVYTDEGDFEVLQEAEKIT